MTPVLDISGLTKRFGGIVAVNDASFSMAAGEIVGLLGPNGSGKTTVINMISGAIPPTAGAIRLGGQRISGLKPNRIARLGVARTFQLVRALPSLTVLENVLVPIAFGRRALWGAEAEAQAMRHLAAVGLDQRANVAAADLTYIDQKRMELARALASEPSLLLLDEWLSGLNPTELRAGITLIEALRDSGMTVLLVEHIMEAVRALCTRCVVMNAGRVIADGATDAVLRDAAVVSAYLGDADA